MVLQNATFSAVTGSYPILNRNLALSLAAGNATIWKPAPTTPLCSIAVTKIVAGALERNGIPGAVASLVTGGTQAGEALIESEYIPMGTPFASLGQFIFPEYILPVSFTGSERAGREVGKVVQMRFGKVLLELGGNNGLQSFPYCLIFH
jgi:aldehyde dehydrogenase family 7 protein A1